MALDPKSLNHFFAFTERFLTKSSLAAATMIEPSETPSGTLPLTMKFSNSADDLYVSNTYECVTFPFVGSMMTRCNPLQVSFDEPF